MAMAACGSLMAAPYHTPFRLELARKGLAFARIADSMNVNDVDVVVVFMNRVRRTRVAGQPLLPPFTVTGRAVVDAHRIAGEKRIFFEVGPEEPQGVSRREEGAVFSRGWPASAQRAAWPA